MITMETRSYKEDIELKPGERLTKERYDQSQVVVKDTYHGQAHAISQYRRRY